jgi:hypothetical protein
MTKRAMLGGTGIFERQEPQPAPARQVDRPDRVGRVPMPFWTTAAAKCEWPSKSIQNMAACVSPTKIHDLC